MAKKHKPKPHKPAPGIQPPGTHGGTALESPEMLRERASKLLSEDNWQGLKELSTSIDSSLYPESQRTAIQTQKLRFMVRALTHGGRIDYVRPPDDAELKATLTEFKQLGNLELNPFDLVQYIKCSHWDTPEMVEVVQMLKRSIDATQFFPLYEEFRIRAHRLKRKVEMLDEEGDSTPGLDMGFVRALIDEAYQSLELAATSPEEKLIVQILKLEQQVERLDPWDLSSTLRDIKLLPEPSADEIQAYYGTDDATIADQIVTPLAWAFMIEVGLCRTDEKSLISAYGRWFSYLPAQAVKRILQSICDDAEYSEAHLREAIINLVTYFRSHSPFGDFNVLFSKSETRVTPVSFGHEKLFFPDIFDTLRVIIEGTCSRYKGYRFEKELLCLLRVLQAESDFDALSDDGDDEDMPGLALLCDWNLEFQFLASTVLYGCAARLILLIDVIQRASDHDIDLTSLRPAQHFDADDFDPAKLPKVLSALKALAVSRPAMSEDVITAWRTVAGIAFETLIPVVKTKEDGATFLWLSRTFQEDLLESTSCRTLAVIEQSFGNQTTALRFWVISLEDDDKPNSAVVANIFKLIDRIADSDELASTKATVIEAQKTSAHQKTFAEFLQRIDRRSNAFREADQFEKTAVNRWPKITGPARQLLGVLHTIDGYSGIQELTTYANMEEKWVLAHMAKLREAGMLIDTPDGKYRINSYITPLLDQENQHSIVGRIVRGKGGDHAYKQVFNSPLEFTIYQIMVQLCPNHLVFPNCSLQSIMSYDRMKESVPPDLFRYYLQSSVDIVVVSSITYLPLIAIELDSIWHDTEHQQRKDLQKDELFATANIPFLRLRPVGSPSEGAIREQVAQHVDELVRSLRTDMPGYDQAKTLIEDLSSKKASPSNGPTFSDVPF